MRKRRGTLPSDHGDVEWHGKLTKERFHSIDAAVHALASAQPRIKPWKKPSVRFYHQPVAHYGRTLHIEAMNNDIWRSSNHLHFDFRVDGSAADVLPSIDAFEKRLAAFEQTPKGAASKRRFAADQFTHMVRQGTVPHVILQYALRHEDTPPHFIRAFDPAELSCDDAEQRIDQFFEQWFFESPDAYAAYMTHHPKIEEHLEADVSHFLARYRATAVPA